MKYTLTANRVNNTFRAVHLKTRKELRERRPPPCILWFPRNIVVVYICSTHKQCSYLLWSYIYIHTLKIALSRNAKESFKKFLDPDCFLDQPQNLISSSSSHFQLFLKISSKSVDMFLSYVANKQAHKQTNYAKNITSWAEVIIL